MKAKFNQLLDDQKRQVQLIEETIQMTKIGYADSLKELERISEEIHNRRKRRKSLEASLNLGAREEGVGAEFPPPSPPQRGKRRASESPIPSLSKQVGYNL